MSYIKIYIACTATEPLMLMNKYHKVRCILQMLTGSYASLVGYHLREVVTRVQISYSPMTVRVYI